MIKLIACDLDNTLLNAQHELDEEDSSIIHQIQQSGIEFMVATGRSYGGAKDLIETFGLTCDYILLNGALIADKDGDILMDTPFPLSLLKQVIELAQKEDVCFHMYSSTQTLTFDEERGSKEGLAHLMNNGFSEEEAKVILAKGKFGVFDREFKSIEEFYESNIVIYKLEMFLSDETKQKKMRSLLAEIEGIEVTNSVVDNIEITSSDAQKGYALAAYCLQHHIEKEEVLVFGDSLNDMNMISTFPNSFAVANAIKPIIKRANYITASNLEHGVSKVLKEVLQANDGNDFLKNFKNEKK